MSQYNSGLGSAAAAARPKPRVSSVCGEAIIDTQNPTESALIKQASYTEDEEAAIESDRRFFRRFQDRRHYIRPSCKGEIATLNDFGEPAPPLGCAWFSIVKKVGPGCRMRRWFVADAGLIYYDASENEALAIWQALGGPSEGRS
jgi:hypothetical protein